MGAGIYNATCGGVIMMSLLTSGWRLSKRLMQGGRFAPSGACSIPYL